MGASQPVYSKTVLLTRRPTTRRRAKMPLITVVMPVYNGEAFVGKSVDSILSQSLGDFEFVIVDDGSTDRTGEILRSYVDPRVRVLKQEHAGLISSLNRAISLASGQYIARMDADDVSLPRRLELQAWERRFWR
jgi:glycosyltransferase involved in cell wall biosynthesis